MSAIKISSIILVLISAILAIYSIYQASPAITQAKSSNGYSTETANTKNKSSVNTASQSSRAGYSISTHTGKTEKNVSTRTNERENKQAATTVTADKSKITLWAKLGFSVVFGLAALFVVLSKKYKEDTEKWAFSVLTLISGVWIGTIS